jgi:polynucleotide 5'-kinase involved in rRNA processing
MNVVSTIRRLEEIGVRVHCLQFGGTDLTSAAGKMTMNVLRAVAQLERDVHIERINKPGWLCCDVAFKSQIRGAVSLLAIFSMVRQDLREHARVKIMVSIVPPASLSATWLIYSGDHVI